MTTTPQQRRAERRRQRSIELANRKGLCRVCGTEMTVSRGTKTTCSDRCRKQWIRKGEQAFPLPETTEDVRFSEDGPIYQLPEAIDLVSDRLSSHLIQLSIKATTTADLREDPVAKDLRRILTKLQRYQLLLKLRTEAPAVFLYEHAKDSGDC